MSPLPEAPTFDVWERDSFPSPARSTHRKRGDAGNLAVTGTCQDSDPDRGSPGDLELEISLDVGLDVGGSQARDLELLRGASGAGR